jgi:hypothetical protein
MRSIVKCSTVAAALAALTLAVAPARAGFDPLEPLDDLRHAVHESLGLPEPDISRLLEHGLPEPDLPVLGFLAHELGKPPQAILDLRLAGMPWLDIALHFGRGPEIFYVPFDADPGPPYGKAWGYYKKTPRAHWSTIRLTDDDVFNLVNVRVCHDYYRVPYDRIVALRRAGRDYRAIHRDLAIQTGRHGHPRGPEGRGEKGGHGGGKGKDKDKGGPPHGHGHGHGR